MLGCPYRDYLATAGATFWAEVNYPVGRFDDIEIVFDYNLIVANKQKCTGMLPDNVRDVDGEEEE